MSLAWVVILVLLMLMVAGGPYTGWHSYQYWPSGIIGIILIVCLILVLLGRL